MTADSFTVLFQQSLPAKHDAVPRFKSGVLEAARLAGWCGDGLGRLELVLEEAAVNIIRYAYPGGSGEMTVTLATADEGFMLRLEDAGIPFDPTTAAAPDLDAALEERPVGGLGIHLMKGSSDEIEYRREGGRNIVTIMLKPGPSIE